MDFATATTDEIGAAIEEQGGQPVRLKTRSFHQELDTVTAQPVAHRP